MEPPLRVPLSRLAPPHSARQRLAPSRVARRGPHACRHRRDAHTPDCPLVVAQRECRRDHVGERLEQEGGSGSDRVLRCRSRPTGTADGWRAGARGPGPGPGRKVHGAPARSVTRRADVVRRGARFPEISRKSVAPVGNLLEEICGRAKRNPDLPQTVGTDYEYCLSNVSLALNLTQKRLGSPMAAPRSWYSPMGSLNWPRARMTIPGAIRGHRWPIWALLGDAGLGRRAVEIDNSIREIAGPGVT